MYVGFAYGALPEPSFSRVLGYWWISDFPMLRLPPSQKAHLCTHLSECEGPGIHRLWSSQVPALQIVVGNLLFTRLDLLNKDSFLNPRSQSSESCFLWALNSKHSPTLFCSPLLPKTDQLIWGLEREFLMRVSLACPHGVKVTSGLCLWPDSLGTAAATSRSWVGAGSQPGQRAGSGRAQHFQDAGSPASADRTPSTWFLQERRGLLSSVAWNGYTFQTFWR